MMFSIDADYLEFGSYDKDNFAVLFVDMRNSTTRAQRLGAEKTFLSMHAYIRLAYNFLLLLWALFISSKI